MPLKIHSLHEMKHTQKGQPESRPCPTSMFTLGVHKTHWLFLVEDLYQIEISIEIEVSYCCAFLGNLSGNQAIVNDAGAKNDLDMNFRDSIPTPR